MIRRNDLTLSFSLTHATFLPSNVGFCRAILSLQWDYLRHKLLRVEKKIYIYIYISRVKIFLQKEEERKGERKGEKRNLYGALNSQLDSYQLKWMTLINFILCIDDSLHNHIPFEKKKKKGSILTVIILSFCIISNFTDWRPVGKIQHRFHGLTIQVKVLSFH